MELSTKVIKNDMENHLASQLVATEAEDMSVLSSRKWYADRMCSRGFLFVDQVRM